MSSRCVLSMLSLLMLLVPNAPLAAGTIGLQFHSVDDCRVFESLSYAPPKPLAAHTAVRIFLSNTNGTVNAQGVDHAGCPDVPNNATA